MLPPTEPQQELAERLGSYLAAALLRDLADAALVVDHAGGILYLNPAGERIFRYPREALVGLPAALLLPARFRTRYLAAFQEFQETGELPAAAQPGLILAQRRNGERFPAEVSLTPCYRDAETYYIALLRDRSEARALRRQIQARSRELRRRNEELQRRTEELEEAMRTLAETQAQLAQTERLASLGHLTAGIAHEINNPLAFVGNNVAVLERDWHALITILNRYEEALPTLAAADPAAAAEVKRLAGEIDLDYVRRHRERILASTQDGLRRVRDIVQNLRDFARTDPPELQEVDLHACLERALEMIAFRLERRNIEVQREYKELPPVPAHPDKLNQVFLNLFINALEAMEESAAPGTLRIRTGTVAGQAQIEVVDSGPGIPADVLPRIFDPFFTTKGPGQGTGLGLSISYGIIKGHGGLIEAEPLPEGGTCFRVRLPTR